MKLMKSNCPLLKIASFNLARPISITRSLWRAVRSYTSRNAAPNSRRREYIFSRHSRLQAGVEQERRNIRKLFEEVDLSGHANHANSRAFHRRAEKRSRLLRPQEIILLRNTRPANVWGLPAISIPCGFTATGLPIGLQIIGAHNAENEVLQLAYNYEQATGWHNREPGILAS